MAKITIGSRMPDMELDALHDGEVRRVRLGDYRGRWLVVVTYPADFTFVCPTELEDAARHHAAFQEAGAEVVSVSTDTVWTHEAWRAASPTIAAVPFPMLADPSGAFCRALGVLIEDEGVARRGTFLVDPDGVVVALELHDNRIGRRMDETLRKVRAAVHVRDHDGEVCPANWEPGAKTLLPSLALVGKL